jgi:haloalkane dehalogenase
MPDNIPYTFTVNKISIDGNSLAYLDEGQGPVIVMLHGNPTWSFYYRNLVTLLCDKYRLIVPDHMGCGNSDKPQVYPYTLKTHIDNAEQLLQALNIKKYSLVVHDWGGAIGMGLAARQPEKIESLVILNTAAFRSKRIPLRISICRVPFLGDIIVRGFNGFAVPAINMAVNKPLPKDVVKGYLQPYNSWANRIAILRFVQDIPLSPSDVAWETLLEVEQGLSQFQNTPMLILWGGKDFCFNRFYFDEWQQRFPNAESHFFTDAGHYVLEDGLDEISPLLTIFFQEHLLKQ